MGFNFRFWLVGSVARVLTKHNPWVLFFFFSFDQIDLTLCLGQSTGGATEQEAQDTQQSTDTTPGQGKTNWLECHRQKVYLSSSKFLNFTISVWIWREIINAENRKAYSGRICVKMLA